VAGYSALALVAAMAAKGNIGCDAIDVTITGGHGELFWQSFGSDGRTSSQPASIPIATLARQLDGDTIFGTGAEALVTARGHGTAVTLYPDARDWPLIATLPPLPPLPVYGREADAIPMPKGQRS